MQVYDNVQEDKLNTFNMFHYYLEYLMKSPLSGLNILQQKFFKTDYNFFGFFPNLRQWAMLLEMLTIIVA